MKKDLRDLERRAHAAVSSTFLVARRAYCNRQKYMTINTPIEVLQALGVRGATTTPDGRVSAKPSAVLEALWKYRTLLEQRAAARQEEQECATNG